MDNNILIQFNDVHKTYQMGSEQVHALAGVSVSFKKGSFWAIMGASGSGKSTMMNLIGCLDRPSSGEYILNGHNVGLMDDNSLSQIRLQNIGFVFQSFNLIPQLSVLENIELPMFYKGHSAAESAEQARKMADLVGLGDRLRHRPTELSGGQQQRVAIARALVNEPPVILADEPTGNLDSATGQQIIELLVQLHQQGKTIIMITHEPDVAGHAQNRLHMRDGLVESIEEQ